VFINVEETPNPNTLKFIPENEVEVQKSFLFKKNDDFNENSFIKNLFDLDGVETVLVDKEFISVTKNKNTSWDSLRTMISSQIGSYLEKNDSILIIDRAEEKKVNKSNKLTKIEKEICTLLDTRVKPVVASHGGEISFHSFEKGIVYLELKGSCAGCPSSTATLKMGIENMLKHYHSEIKEVVEITN
jgi:Fe-S cluster biogenesis protein NfuA